LGTSAEPRLLKIWRNGRTCFLFLNLLMAYLLRAHDRNIAHALALERQAEFVVLVSGVGNDDDVVAVSCKILSSLALPYELDALTLTASLGISRCPQEGKDVDTLLKQADAAMYGVKRDGRGADRQPGTGKPAAVRLTSPVRGQQSDAAPPRSRSAATLQASDSSASRRGPETRTPSVGTAAQGTGQFWRPAQEIWTLSHS
jgi:hypothetical protein